MSIWFDYRAKGETSEWSSVPVSSHSLGGFCFADAAYDVHDRYRDTVRDDDNGGYASWERQVLQLYADALEHGHGFDKVREFDDMTGQTWEWRLCCRDNVGNEKFDDSDEI